MEIIWHGYSCFTIKTKEGTAVLNPYSSEIGLKLPTLKASVVLVSANEPTYNNTSVVQNEPKVIDWPGEYEVAGIAITVMEIRSQSEKETSSTTLFTLDADNLKVCFVTDINKNILEKIDELVETIGDIDILLVPVSGDHAGYKEAHQLIEDMEPRVVIPMRYQTPGLTLKLEGLENFTKQAGIANLEAKDKFTLNSKSEASEEKTEYVILNPQLG